MEDAVAEYSDIAHQLRSTERHGKETINESRFENAVKVKLQFSLPYCREGCGSRKKDASRLAECPANSGSEQNFENIAVKALIAIRSFASSSFSKRNETDQIPPPVGVEFAILKVRMRAL